MNQEFFRDLHDKEFVLKERLSQRASTIIAGSTTLSGAIGFMLMNHESNLSFSDYSFYLATVFALLSAAYCVFYLIYSYLVPPLDQVASPVEWKAHWEELLAKYQQGRGEFESVEAEFTDSLINHYAEITDTNIKTNFKRGDRLTKSNNGMLGALVLVVIASLCFYYSNQILSPRGIDLMNTVSLENSFVCVPVVELGGGPRPRPEPNPAPQPPPVD